MADDDLASRASEADAGAGGPAESGIDAADASHEGGIAAQGGAVDFGKAKDFGLPQ